MRELQALLLDLLVLAVLYYFGMHVGLVILRVAVGLVLDVVGPEVLMDDEQPIKGEGLVGSEVGKPVVCCGVF